MDPFVIAIVVGLVIIGIASLFGSSSKSDARSSQPTHRREPSRSTRDQEPDVYGEDQHRPEGKWVEATLREEAVGIQYRKQDVETWADEVRRAERAGRFYGVDLELEPDNQHDPNAIKVIGIADCGSERKRWHIGYVARETAADIQSDLVSRGLAISGELQSIFRVGNFIGVYFVILAPPRNSHSVRMKRRPLNVA